MAGPRGGGVTEAVQRQCMDGFDLDLVGINPGQMKNPIRNIGFYHPTMHQLYQGAGMPEERKPEALLVD